MRKSGSSLCCTPKSRIDPIPYPAPWKYCLPVVSPAWCFCSCCSLENGPQAGESTERNSLQRSGGFSSFFVSSLLSCSNWLRNLGSNSLLRQWNCYCFLGFNSSCIFLRWTQARLYTFPLWKSVASPSQLAIVSNCQLHNLCSFDSFFPLLKPHFILNSLPNLGPRNMPGIYSLSLCICWSRVPCKWVTRCVPFGLNCLPRWSVQMPPGSYTHRKSFFTVAHLLRSSVTV